MAQDMELVVVGEELVTLPEDRNINDQPVVAMKSADHHLRKI